MTLPYTNFIFDYMRSGLAADRPANPETTDNVNPDAITQYFAIDTKVLSTWSTQDTTWYDTAFTDLLAASISFDPAPSGLTSTNVQDAIDEIRALILTDAGGISYDNSGSGLASTNVQDAIDEVALGSSYSDERAQDAVCAIFTNGGGITWNYNDGANTMAGTVSLAGFTTTNLAEGANLYFTNERVDDRVAALIVNGTGLTWTYDDTANTLTGNVSVTAYTDEMAEDAVGGILTDTNTIDFTYDDAGNTIKADVLFVGEAQARISAATATPVITSTITGATSHFVCLYKGNYGPVVRSGTSRLEMRTFAELSQTLADTTKSPAAAVGLRGYDVWVWDNSGTLRATRGPGWTDGGRTATVTIASPGVWTLNSHGFFEGQPVVPTTSGALPTGYTAGTIYYIVGGAALTTNTFQLSATAGGAAINTSGTQSGTHTITNYTNTRGTGAGSEEHDTTTFPGFRTNKYDITNGPAAGKGIYYGSFITDASGTLTYTVGGSGAAGGESTFQSIWNFFQRKPAKLINLDNTNTYTYSSNAFRAKNAGATGNGYNNSIKIFVGLVEDVICIQSVQEAKNSNSGQGGGAGIGLNTSTAPIAASWVHSAAGNNQVSMPASFATYPILGYQQIFSVESGDGTATQTWYGDNGTTYFLSTISAQIDA